MMKICILYGVIITEAQTIVKMYKTKHLRSLYFIVSCALKKIAKLNKTQPMVSQYLSSLLDSLYHNSAI